jgi:hypothetical protein
MAIAAGASYGSMALPTTRPPVSGPASLADDATSAIRPTPAPTTSSPHANGGFSGHSGFELRNHPMQPVRNSQTTIGQHTYSGHALDQMQNRGVYPSVVENTIQNGVTFAGNRPATHGVYDPVNNVTVIQNSNTGNVITVRFGGR